MNNIIKDLSDITTISENVLNKLKDKAIWSICDSFKETILANEDICKIDIAIGTLLISNSDDNIKYKFIPNETLESSIKDVAINKINPLELALEKTLANKIIKTYKDIL